MKHLFPAGVASMMIAGSAFAADMPVKTPAPAPSLDWNGFYLGGTFGGDWSDKNFVNVVTTNSFINFPVLSPLGVSAATTSATASSAVVGAGKTRGFTGGFEAGYNYQFDFYHVVVGLETDIEYLVRQGFRFGHPSRRADGIPRL